MNLRYVTFFGIFTLGALLCLGIALTSYPWGITTTQEVGFVLIYGTVDFIVAFLMTAWLVTARD